MALTERQQRQVERLLDQAETAFEAGEWDRLLELSQDVLTLDPENVDAKPLETMAQRRLNAGGGAGSATEAQESRPVAAAAPAAIPESFAAGRYHVRRFLGEGGKKRVFLAHDQLLDRDVAFALIKTEGLDDVGRERITREAQAMGRLGAHPNVVSIYDIGEEGGAPYVVTELMGGGDIEGELTKAAGALPLIRTLEIAKGVTRGLAFAHAQGIVHRDLKPGNVWLTDDGVAKIGDFGLAVNLERSRLTQHGLMVGTFAYMPPEQALGGEVTPRSDLYSLGAMLYELVTGKPPFSGDDPTAVISQHLNATPVAPSWNSEHCPPALEALILKLLAKVPADRPASAGEVLAALEAVDPDAATARHSDSSVNPLDRLARGVFVGRERELERLRSAFDSAFAGHGSVVMLVGEPGIGKTRAAQEAETYARLRGAQVLWGRANEAEGAPPYFPWRQAAMAYRAQNPDELRRKEWGPYAVELQRIFTALRDLFPNLPEPPDIDSAEGQFRLFEAMSGFLRDVSERVPLVIVLDDLHWADKPTLQMLAHIARDVGHSRILLLGTYRDTDLDRTHPLSQTLGELNRESLFTRIPLRGLSRDEVAAYISAVAHAEPVQALVARIHEETEGNPFFLGEVVNLLAQEGTLARAGNTSISDLAIPEGVKEALGRRLDRLSPEANNLLQLASVVGREFSHDLLVALTGQDDEAVLALIEEALAGRVIEETGQVGGYRFTHALMQETLAGELSAARQVRLHGQIAQALERIYGARAEANAQEMARHYTESAVLNHAHAQQAAHYSRVAAEQATAQFAWDEAVQHYQRCLAIIVESPAAISEDDAAVHASLSRCAARTSDWRTHWRSALAALSVYRERGDWVSFARVAVDISRVSTPNARLFLLLLEATDGLGAEGDLLTRARLATARMALAGLLGDTRVRAFGEEASRLVEEAADPVMQATFVLDRHDQFGDADADQLDAAAGALRSLGTINAHRATYMAGHELAAAAAIDSAMEHYRQAIAHQRRHHLNTSNCAAWLASLHLARGEYDACHALIDEHRERFDIGIRDRFMRLAELAGDFDEAMTWLSDPAAFRGTPAMTAPLYAMRAHALWRVGKVEEAKEAAVEMEEALLACGDQGLAIVGALTNLDEAGPELTSSRLAAFVRTGFPRSPGFPRISLGNAVLGGRFRGDWAMHFGDLDEAERSYAEALDVARRERLVIEEGRTQLGLANLAERHGDIETARAHLDAAGELFAKCGAKLYLDQVIAKKEILKA